MASFSSDRRIPLVQYANDMQMSSPAAAAAAAAATAATVDKFRGQREIGAVIRFQHIGTV